MFAFHIGKYAVSKVMTWWLLGGVAAAATTYAVFSEDKPELLTLKVPILKRRKVDLPPGTEKFMDPIYACNVEYVRKGGDGDWIPTYRWAPGAGEGANIHGKAYNTSNNAVAYLSVENTAHSRVEAMRATVNYYKGRPSSELTERRHSLMPFVKASEATMLKLANSLYNSYRDIEKNAEKASEFAENFGVSTESVRAEAHDLIKAMEGTEAYRTIDTAMKKWGPVAQATSSGIQAAMTLAAGSGEGGRSNLVALMKGIESVALMIPLAGPFIALAASMVGGVWAAADVAAEEFCREEQAKVWSFYNEGIQLEFPMTWHGTNTFPDSCVKKSGASASGWEPPQNLMRLETIFRAQLTRFRQLSTNMLAPTQQWWRLAMTHMSDERVLDVFTALGADSYGGTLASDEQVLLVAAPIAVANGLDVYEFAKKLWDYSDGWRAGGDALKILKTAESGGKNGSINFSKATCDKYMAEGKYACQCDSPFNAHEVQFGVLANDAFDLVRSLRPIKVKLVKGTGGRGVGGIGADVSHLAGPGRLFLRRF